MAAQIAPFSNAMRLGQGFNTYTQELRLEGAVKITPAKSQVDNGDVSAQASSQSQLSGGSSTTTAGAPALFPSAAPAPSSSDDDKKLADEDIIKVPSVKISGPVKVPATPDPKDFSNASMVALNNEAIRDQASTSQKGAQLFSIPPGPVKHGNQSVTFSTRAINNMSDIMDALNISASMSIKYGTIHGNASAAYVNEDKVLDSQLNYLVSVRVNNNSLEDPESMEFDGLDEIPPEKFTEVYGDCFIAGFIEGGEFNAIISVDCHDKSRITRVKDEIDLQLSVPPVPGLSMGAGQGFDKGRTELLQGTEITISVNWVGGGEVKPPGVPWTLQTVVAAANAFPSMVARSSARVSAILKPYTSLRSFHTWTFKQSARYGADAEKITDKEAKAEKLKEAALWLNKAIVLNYAPCTIYTNDLFDAYITYKKLWKRISFIMKEPSKWKMKSLDDVSGDLKNHRIEASPETAKGFTNPPFEPRRQDSRRSLPIPEDVQAEFVAKKENVPSGPPSTQTTMDSITRDFGTPTHPGGLLTKFDTFPVENPNIKDDWDLKVFNDDRTPISLDPVELNEARLLCREALTLITEEAASLVTKPELAYAQFDEKKMTTKMKRPIYVYPEVLMARLPVFIRNDATADSTSRDAAMLRLRRFIKKDGEIYAHIIGDTPSELRTYTPFVSLERNEDSDVENALMGLSLHAYSHHARYWFSNFSRDSHRAIGGIGFCFAADKNPRKDGCTQWEGECDPDDDSLFKKMLFRNAIKDLKQKDQPQARSSMAEHHAMFGNIPDGHSARALNLNGGKSSEALDTQFAKDAADDKNITKIEVYWVPGSGRISGLVFHDAFGPTDLAWKQWEEPGSLGTMPRTMRMEAQTPPDGKWRFVGLMGDWDDGRVTGKVLARVSGIWRKA